MTSSVIKNIDIPTIGLVLLEKSSRAKNMTISIKYPQTIRVTIPFGISFKSAERFVESKINWIEKQLVKIKSYTDDRIGLKPIDINKARPYLEKRINQLAEKYSFTFNRLFIKNQKTRWGSCSHKNNINLNARLLHLPSDLIDYVILHELVHTKIKNHSKKFRSTLDVYVGDSRWHDKELRKYKIL